MLRLGSQPGHIGLQPRRAYRSVDCGGPRPFVTILQPDVTSLQPYLTGLQPNLPTMQTCVPRRQPKASTSVGAMPPQVHCFTAEALAEPKGRPLALHSHAKQRALFQES